MLRIVADDLGLHKSVNDGIVFLLKEKKIDGASLMSNGEAFEDAVRQCEDAQVSNIGVHLNLVEQDSVLSGKPLLKDHKVFFIKYILRLVKKDFIQKELEAQVQKVVQAGIKPVFINGNQHLHLLPGIMDMVIRLAGKYGIDHIRIVNQPISLGKGKLFKQLQLLFLNFLSKLAKNKIRKAGLKCNDYFVGFINAGKLSEDDIKQTWELAKKYPDKEIELGSHPGRNNEELKELKNKDKYWGRHDWEQEFNLLRNMS